MYTSILLATLLSANAPMRYAPVRGVMYQPAITYAAPMVTGSVQVIMTAHGPVYVMAPVTVSAPAPVTASAEAEGQKAAPAAASAPAAAPVYVQAPVYAQPQHFAPAPMMFGGFSGGRACST